MAQPLFRHRSNSARRQIAPDTVVGSLIVLTPATCLTAYWVGGEFALVLATILLPFISGICLLLPKLLESGDPIILHHSELPGRPVFEELTGTSLGQARHDGRKTAVFMIEIDEYDTLVAHHGPVAAEQISQQAVKRIRSSLRGDDIVGYLAPSTFAVTIHPQATMDLEICLEISGRLARSLSEPYAVDGTTVYITASIGFCQLGRETAYGSKDGSDPVLVCAERALQSARAAAPGAIRAYTAKSRGNPQVQPSAETLDVVEALDNGEIVPWFQPQISTDTGKITGFEALARWIHPVRGPIPPCEFLPHLEDAQRMERLSEVMIYHSLTAIRAWDKAGEDVQQVGVNFSTAELSDPKLVEKIAWELDRFELGADRLAVEILETVVAQGPDDVITRNIKGLRALGCRIDLDDFGTGQASLSSIRRFGVGRIKIDRSFVMKADRDAEQQRMIRAILTLAEKLDLETLAEGVETVGEHSLLAQLGCNHVQGFGIARPMPFEQTLSWIREHEAKVQAPPQIGRASG